MAPTPGNDYSMKIIPWDETYRPGTGVDYTTRQARASILEKFGTLPLTPATGARSQKVKSVLRRVETKEELVETLSLQLTGSGSLAPPQGSLSGSFFGKFVDEVKISTYHLHFLLIVQVVNGSEFISDETVKAVLRTQLPADFQQRYGDHLVYGVTTGGLYLSVLEIVTRTEEKKQEVITALNLSGSTPASASSVSSRTPGLASAKLVAGGPGDAGKRKDDGGGAQAKDGKAKDDKAKDDKAKDGKDDDGKSDDKKDGESEVAPGEAVDKTGAGAAGGLKLMISKARTIRNTEIRSSVQRIGGQGELAMEDPDKMVAQASTFPAQAAQHGVPVYAILKPYSQVEGLPDRAIEQVLSGQYIRCREQLVRCLLRAQSILDNLDYALDPAYRTLFAQTEQELQASRERITAHIGQVTGLLTELQADPRKFLAAPDYQKRIPPLLSLSLIPQRLRKIAKRRLTPARASSPRVPARLVHDLVLADRTDRLPADVRDRIEELGAYLVYAFTQIAAMAERIPWGFEGGQVERLRIAAQRHEETVRALAASMQGELPERIAAIADALGRYKDLSPAVRNDVNALLSRVQPGDDQRGGLFEHLAPLQATSDELKAILPLLGQAKLGDIVECDEQGWALYRQEYDVAVRILGHAVRFGLHERAFGA